MRIALALALVLALFAGCTSESDFAPIASPEWQPGYSFTYQGQGEYFEDFQGRSGDRQESQSGTAPLGPARVFTMQVVNTADKANGEPAYFAIADGDDPEPISTRLRESSGKMDTLLAFDPGTLEARQVANVGCKTCPVSAYSNAGRVHDWLRFPLHRGDTWTTENLRVPGGNFPADLEATVGGMATVEGPDGPVEAVHVTHAVTTSKEFLDGVEEDAAEEGIAVHTFSATLDGTVEVYYAPSLHAIVLKRYDIKTRLDVDADGPEGRYVVKGNSRLQFDLRLAGYDLTVKPQTPLTQVPSLLGKVVTVGGVTGSAPYLSATVSRERSKGGDGPVTLTAESQGLSGGVTWKVHDGAGKTFLEGSGPTLQVPTTTPGSFQARAEALSTNGDLLRSSVGFAIDYDETLTMACDTAVTLAQGDCRAGVPIARGLEKATLTATRTGTLPQLFGGRLGLEVDGVAVASEEFQGGVAEIVYDEGVPLNGAWEAVYSSSADSASLSLQVKLEFEVPAV